MNFSDDFEENLSMIIKWLMIISLATIVIWGVVNIFKAIFVRNEPAKVSTNTEMVKENYLSKSNEEVENEIEHLEKDIEGELFEESEDLDSHVEVVGNKIFKLNVKELPEDLFFGLQSSVKNFQKRQEAINKKVGENYIDSVLSYGSLERWNPKTFPLQVYIERNPNVPHNHINELKSAFIKWQERTNDFISFVFVRKPDQADILCLYPENFNRSCVSAESSETSRQYFSYDADGKIKNAKIELTYKDCNGQKYADDLVYAFALREVGHALGLRGHSGMTQGQPIFYTEKHMYKGGRPEIQNADINTLKLVYSLMPDKTNLDFTEDQLQKLIKPEEVWGDKVERIPESEKAILYNIERSPDIPALHISLANYYSANGHYDKALEVYSRSIVLLNEAEMKARVYVRVGDTFSSQYRYSEAAEAYKLSLKNLDKKQNLFEVYFNLGYVYYKQNHYEEALKAYQSAFQYASSKEWFYKLLMNMSLIYLKVGKFQNAQKCVEKAISLYKTSDSQYLVAYVRYLNQDFDNAQLLLEELVQNYDYALGYGLLAQIYYKTGQFEALKLLSETASDVFAGNVPFSFE